MMVSALTSMLELEAAATNYTSSDILSTTDSRDPFRAA